MANKGFENGCIMMAHGVGHTPKEGHNCIYANVDNELITVHADSNQYKFVNSAYHRCGVTKSADQSIPKAVWTSLTFDQEKYDIGGLHDNIDKNHRLTIAEYGEYELTYHIKHEANDKTGYQARVIKNGFIEIDGTCNYNVGSKDSSYNIMALTSMPMILNEDEYIELQFYHDNDLSQDVIYGNTFLSIKRIY